MSRVVARGRFRVDRRRALEKMERFQLEDPLRYVLEWLAAAVVDGAQRVEIRNDSDDFELSWAGSPVSQHDLDTLFDHLFGRPEGAAAAMRQHLAVGVLGALARQPRWLHVEADGPDGPLRLAVDDPTRCAAASLGEAVGGVRCHVRDRLTQQTALEALLLAFREPAEARMIRGAARWCPVPVVVNGQPLPPPVPPADALLGRVSDDASLWVVAGEVGDGVDVVRHGIVVHHLEVALPPCRVVGWVAGDGVRLNASRSAVVDTDLRGIRERLAQRVDQLLAEELVAAGGDRGAEVRWGEPRLGRPRARATRGELLDALALHGLRRGGATADALRCLAVLPDLAGRRWSLADLDGEDVGWLDDEALRAWAAPGEVLFAARFHDVLELVDGASDRSHTLRVRRAVAQRRAALSTETRHPWAIDGRPPLWTDRQGGFRLGMGVDLAGPDRVRVRLLLDGVQVAEAGLPGIGVGMEALVDGPFTLAGLDAEVHHDEVYGQALELVRGARWSVVAVALRAASEPHAVRLLTGVLRPVLAAAAGRDERRRAVAGLPDAVGHAPVVRWRGRRWSAVDLLQGAEPSFVVDRLPEPCPAEVAEQTLVVPGRLVHDWGAWLDVPAPGRDAVDRAVRRAQRLNGPRHQARLLPPPAHRVVREGEDLHGELGHAGFDGPSVAQRLARRARGALAPDRSGVRVLWTGVEVGTVDVPQLPGVVGVVEGPTLALTDELTLTPRAVRSVEAWIDGAVLALVSSLWDAVPAGERLPHELVVWLQRRHDRVPRSEASRPVLYRVGGDPLTLADLRRLDRRRKGSRKLVLLRRHPGDVPGFDQAVVVSEAERDLVAAMSQRGWRDGDRDLEDAAEQLRNLTSLAPFQPPLRPVAHRRVQGDGWRGRAFLPSQLDVAGKLRVVALFRGRELAVRTSGRSAGVLLVVEGFTPNRRCTDVADRRALTELKERSEDLLVDMVRDLLASGEIEARHLPAMRVVAARVKAAGRRNRAMRKLARELRSVPMVRRLDGRWWSPDQLVVRRAAGKALARVAPPTPEGPADHGGYVRSDPGVEALLEGWLGEPVSDGTAALATWREGQERKRRAERVSPRRHGPRAWALDGALNGFVSLVEGEAGLVVEPIVGQVALEAVRRPFPLAVRVSVTGEGLEAAADWRTLVDPEASLAAVEAAVTERLDRAVTEGELGGQLARTWVVARGPGGGAAGVPLFRRVGATPASLSELVQAGRAYAVSHDRIRPPCGWSAVLRPPEGLARWVDLVSLDPLLARMDEPPHDRPPAGALARQPVPGGLLWVSEAVLPRIDVLLEGRVVARIPPPAGLAMEGAVAGDGDGVVPRPDGEGLVDDSARERLQARLVGWADALVEVVCRRLPHDDRARRVLERAMVERLGLRRGLRRMKEQDDPLLDAPLFVDSTGAWGTLREVVSTPVRAVLSELDGAPDEGRMWRLTASQRQLLSRFVRVDDASDELRDLLRGRRRRARPYVAPSPPPGARRGADGEVRWALWAGPQGRDDQVAVVVDGSKVQDLDLGGAGVAGVVTGPLPTDRAFTRAQLPDGLVRQLRREATAVLQGELQQTPRRWTERMVVARQQGVELADGACGQVVVARDGEGQPVSVRRLLRAARGAGGRGRWRWVVPGASADGPSQWQLMGEADRRRWVEQALGSTIPLAVPRDASPRSVAGSLRAPVRALTDGAIDDAVEVIAEVPPPLRRAAESDEGARWLVAWGVASRASAPEGAVDEVALVERLVRALTDVG